MIKAEFTEKCTSHRSMLRLMPALVFQQETQSIPKVTSGGTRSTQLLAMCSGSLENITTYLPGSQGDQTRVFAKRTFLHLAHKLGQLGVSAAAVVDLQWGRTKGRQEEHGSQSPTYDQSYKEAAKHFSKVHLAQAFKNTREGTCLSAALELLRPKAPPLFFLLHLPLFPFNFPRSL